MSAPSSKPDFEAIFKALPGLYLILDPDLIIVAASDAYLAATLTSRERIVGRHVFEVFPDNPDDPNADSIGNSRASFLRVRQQKVADAMVVQRHDVRRPESEGGGYEVRYWSPVNLPLLNSDGSLAYIIHRVENVTDFILERQREAERSRETDNLKARSLRIESDLYERSREAAETSRRLKQTNEELARLNVQLRELEAAKARFFANISHELRTPLTLILGPARSLLASGDLPEQRRRELAVIERNALVLLKHVNDLLDLSKLDARAMDIRYSRTDLTRLVRFVAAHFESGGERADVNFSFQTPAAEFFAEVDASKVQRVLFNLLSNAFKFTPGPGVIRLKLEAGDAEATFTVEDSGPGIPKPMRERVFDRFQQVDDGAARRQGGTGLGLAIVKEFVHLHRGSVSVGQSSLGGARFVVRLPSAAPPGLSVESGDSRLDDASAEQAVAELRPTPASPPAAAAPASGRAVVLVAEDNPEMNEFITRSLGGRFAVASARDGREALAKALELRPDLIVSDLMMPGMSGERLLAEIRRRRDLDDIPVLILTARTDEALRVSLLREGAQDLLIKPFAAGELEARAAGLVEHKARLERLADANVALSGFAYSAAHDLRAPLRSISGFVGLTLGGHAAGLSPEGRALLERAAQSADRMSRLLDDMVLYSRTSGADLKRAPVKLEEAVEDAVAMLESEVTAKNAVIEIKRPLPAVLGDQTTLVLLVGNLLSNALKFMPAGTTPRIEISAEKAGPRVRLSVRDNGIGIAPEDQSSIFAPFERLHSLRDFPGTGLGLSIVRKGAERMGGEAGVESEPGKGSRFWIELSPP